jgi:hypothetical protein
MSDFDNAESMLNAWRECFVGIEEPGSLSDHEDQNEIRRLLEAATFDTQIPELGLGTRATNALDRANVLTVEDLLTVPVRRLLRLRGVGNKTRREIVAAVRILRERLGNPERPTVAYDAATDKGPEPQGLVEVGNLSVDQIIARISRTGSREGDTARETLQALLGLGGIQRVCGQRSAISGQQSAVSQAQDNLTADKLTADRYSHWPSQTDVATLVGVTRARVGQLVGKFQERWAKDPPLTSLTIQHHRNSVCGGWCHDHRRIGGVHSGCTRVR